MSDVDLTFLIAGFFMIGTSVIALVIALAIEHENNKHDDY